MAAASPIGEAPYNTETDEETIAFRKKRSRRVSFADREITSVHIFNRDEDSETPPNSFGKNVRSEGDNEVLGFFRDLADRDDYKEMSPNGVEDDDDDDDIVNVRKSFLRPIGSPSPGSSIVGSATSNEDDYNFSGPVSANFIRCGELSDSAASDDNHDITMDSTAFSMHYRSLARSDSGSTFGEKTPSHITTPSASESSMVLTKAMKKIPQVSLTSEKASDCKDSNDMSLICKNPRNYDYGKLSPTLEALLADSHDVSVFDSENPKLLSGDSCTSHKDESLAADASVDQQMQTLDQLSKLQVNNDNERSVIRMNLMNTEFPAVNDGGQQSMNSKVLQLSASALHESRKISNKGCSEDTPNCRSGIFGVHQNFDQQPRSPLSGSIFSSSAKLGKVFLDGEHSVKLLTYVTPSPKQPGSLFGNENIKSGENLFPIYESSSSLKIFEPSPLSSSLKDGIKTSKRRLLKLLSPTTSSLDVVAEESCKGSEGKNVDNLVNNLEKQIFSVDQNSRQHDRTDGMDDASDRRPEIDGMSGKNNGALSLTKDGEPLIHTSSHNLIDEGDTQLMTKVHSPSQLIGSQKKVQQDILMPEKSKQQRSVVFGSDSPSFKVNQVQKNDSKTSIPLDSFVSSPAKTVDKKLLSLLEHQGTAFQEIQYDDLISIDLVQIGKVTIKNNSTAVTDESELLSAEGKNVQSLAGIEMLSPNSSTSESRNTDCHMELQVSQSKIPEQYIKNSFLQKRRIEESIPEDADHADKVRRINRTPEIHKNQCSKTNFNHWSDVLQRFSMDTQQLHFPLIDKLSIKSIIVLQDILVHLQKTKMYEMLCSHIMSQKICDESSEVQLKRVAEAKMLLYKLAYEKARQQLMSINCEKLVKSQRELSSAITKSEMLKLNRRYLFLPTDRDATVDSISNSCTVNPESKHEGSREKVASMKQEYEALDRKIKNLTKSLHNYCKIKGEPSCSETIGLLNEQLKKKTTCRFIRESLQLWEVDDFGSRNGKQNIALNYQGLICQRFAIKDSTSPSIIVSSILNDAIIAKNFPNMEACLAFACVHNDKTSKKHVGFRSFALETQITSSRLHNLLDVVGEIQSAQLEIRNLVQTCFRSSSVEQLDLQLCFIDFSNGQKVMVTLDMTCLNCGVYPSDVIPYRLEAYIAGTYVSMPESLSVKIKSAVDSVGVGYSRIIRLCRCISKVVQPSCT